MPRKKPNEEVLNRRQLALADGDYQASTHAIRKMNGVVLSPNTQGLKDRALERVPYQVIDVKKVPKELPTDIVSQVDDANQTYKRVPGIIQPEYNLLEPYTILDTEPLVHQAINRRLSLMFRNGFEITGNSPQDIEYIENRLKFMEFVMEMTTEELFKKILNSLLLCSNCFLKKIRKTEATPVKQKEDRKEPVAGYLLIPAHTIFPYQDDMGKVRFWRRFFETGMPYEDIPIDDIIHLKWDVKPGHRFGTPRTVGVKEDILALRRLEENVELLFINHLFPLFHIKVGSETNPAQFTASGHSEVELVKMQIETMPKEGVFVTDERVEAKVVGAEGKGLNPEKFMDHYKSRIYTGLGMSAVDMGDAKGAGSRATADNVSQNLKDAIKADLESFGGAIRMQLFKEFFQEATYSVSVHRALANIWLKFHEIDLDNKIKYENHVTQLFTNNLIDEDEMRKELGRRPVTNEQRKKMFFALYTLKEIKAQADAQTDSQMELNEQMHAQQKEILPLQSEHAEKQAETEKGLLKAKVQHSAATSSHKVSVLQAKTEHLKAGGGKVGGKPGKKTTKSSKGKKATQNKETPTNQHGSNLGPTKAKSSLESISAELTDQVLDLMDEQDGEDPSIYLDRLNELIGPTLSNFDTLPAEIIGSPHTSQIRAGIENLPAFLATTDDPDLVTMLIAGVFLPKDQNGTAEINDPSWSDS